jgi:hypothetical protein
MTGPVQEIMDTPSYVLVVKAVVLLDVLQLLMLFVGALTCFELKLLLWIIFYNVHFLIDND